ncbi:GNAT family N-acetyltransferase [Pseudothauera nasutitermitis]|uniref:GNAT family N-acetyltransferase n=1 Tax=Pseudothauera nasutitermitis TaxID=2565930 RepID=UPI001B3B2784|nr:GNAT family N-acetyltransferase [Pseudothauera nasutitermitis]
MRQNIRLLGWVDGLLLMASRLLERLSGGRARIVRYHLIAQPTRHALPFKAAGSPFSETAFCHPDSPAVAGFPRAGEVIAARFRRGHECLCTRVGGEFAGFLWLARAQYDEDEVRCRYRLLAPERSAWDYDVYVAPEFRIGRSFFRLWERANAHLAAQGIDWSFSRISAFNADSLKSHARLGARRLGSVSFLCMGSAQLTVARALPFPHVHLSLSDRSRPRLDLRPPDHEEYSSGWFHPTRLQHPPS